LDSYEKVVALDAVVPASLLTLPLLPALRDRDRDGLSLSLSLSLEGLSLSFRLRLALSLLCCLCFFLPLLLLLLLLLSFPVGGELEEEDRGSVVRYSCSPFSMSSLGISLE
jgi:hypothetical protein